METIKNYLEAMFASMPDTVDVRKAKDELLQMMEDKYNELIAEGSSENAAVGTVISEFGNLEELAEDLGLAKEVEEVSERAKEQPRRFVSMAEVKDFLEMNKKHALMVALGVFLCVTCAVWPILAEGLFGGAGRAELYGVAGLFISIAAGVGLFVYSGIIDSAWDYFEKEPCQIDFSTADMVRSMKSGFQSFRAAAITIGCVLCIISVLPCIFFSNVIAIPALLLFFVGMGVFLFVYTGCISAGFDKVLGINDGGTISGKFGKEGEKEYINHAAEVIMEVYWTTITCVYLVWSFVTFDWGTTWIIWPVAAIAHKILDVAFTKEA